MESAPKPKSNISHIPLMRHVKFDQDWPTDFGVSVISLLKIYAPSRARNFEMTDPIRPEFELVRDFMPVLVTSKFDEDPIKNERSSLEIPFSHYESMGECFRRSVAPNSVGSGAIWPEFELLRDFMSIPVTCKFKKDQIKNNREKVETSFFQL